MVKLNCGILLTFHRVCSELFFSLHAVAHLCGCARHQPKKVVSVRKISGPILPMARTALPELDSIYTNIVIVLT